MSEPIISPWIFYFIDTWGKAYELICMAIPVVLLLMFFATIIGTVDCRGFNVEELPRLTRFLRYGSIIALILVVLVVVLPSQSTVVKMLVAQQVTKQNIHIATETVDKLIDHIIQKVNHAKAVKKLD